MNLRKILLIFIDGLGIGEPDPNTNPLTAHPDLWPCGNDGSKRPGLQWTSCDACLGVDGLPQSATGQTALLTGVNAPQVIGRHKQGFPSKALIEILQERSIFVQLQTAGLNAAFANAYRHPEDIEPHSRLSVTSHAFKAAGKPFRSISDIEAGDALYHDFTNEELRKNGYEAPLLTPQQAGELLVKLALKHDFTLYEHFLTDVIAHRGNREAISLHIEKLSNFIRTVLDFAASEEMNVIITSDHGNIEDNTVRTHTTNPVPLIWTGNSEPIEEPLPGAITEITPWIVRQLSPP